MHSSRVEKVPTESQGDEAPIIHSAQAPSAKADVARESRQIRASSTRIFATSRAGSLAASAELVLSD